jgi:hypothetical protein
MYWRDLRFYRNTVFVLLALGFTILLLNQWSYTATQSDEYSRPTEPWGNVNSSEDLSYRSNDLALSYPFTKNENIDHSCYFSLQRDRPIRSSLFDAVQVQLLTEKLAWFTRQVYRSALAALWRPSILIAQGKLTI